MLMPQHSSIIKKTYTIMKIATALKYIYDNNNKMQSTNINYINVQKTVANNK